MNNDILEIWRTTGLLKDLDEDDSVKCAWHLQTLMQEAVQDDATMCDVLFPLQRRIFPKKLGMEGGVLTADGALSKITVADVKQIADFSKQNDDVANIVLIKMLEAWERELTSL